MKLSCIMGRHWPEAAAWERTPGVEFSRCVDCDTPMVKQASGNWQTMPKSAARPKVLGRLVRERSSG